MNLQELQEHVRRFAHARDWEQFQNPKNLSMAMAGEAGELLALFQWLTPEQSATVMDESARAQDVRHEMADVFIYLLRMADVLGVDLSAAVVEKMAINERRYPAEASRGRADKYTAYQLP